MRLVRSPLNSASVWGTTFAAISLALLAGSLLTARPWVIAPFVVATGLLVLTALGRRTTQLFLVTLASLLIGFLFYSRAFSYIGFPPLYISESVLALGLLALVFARVRRRISGFHLLLFAFLLLGLVHTIPYVSVYGIDALRDAAIWYYALFAIIVSLLLSTERLERFIGIYARVLPILAVWLALMPIFFRFAPGSLREIGAFPFPFFYSVKPGDRAVVLVGLAAFVATGLYARVRGNGGIPVSYFWAVWAVSALLVMVKSRGGMLGIALACAIVVMLRPSRQLFNASIVGIVLFLFLLVVNPTIDLGGIRALSVSQIRTNALSVVSNDTANAGGVQGTKEWRLKWWRDITEQTFSGPYFWTGQGFGVNLADEYGFQTDGLHHSLRSPHSIHMSILARMGVPGLLLWTIINVAFASQILQVHRRARQQNQPMIADVSVWLLAIWAASLVNGSFDVYLESPYGAIPFWCVVGAGMALSAIQREWGSHANSACA